MITIARQNKEQTSEQKEEVRVRVGVVVRPTPFSAEEIWRFHRPLQILTEKKNEARQDMAGPKQDQVIRCKGAQRQRHTDER